MGYEKATEKDDMYSKSVLKPLQEVDLEAVFAYSEKGDQLALCLRKQCLDV